MSATAREATPCCLRSPSMNSIFPLLRSSTTRILAPFSASACTKQEPMKEAPPVTNTLRFFQFISILLVLFELSDMEQLERNGPHRAWNCYEVPLPEPARLRKQPE